MTSAGFRLHQRHQRPLQLQRGLKLSLFALVLSSPAFGLAVGTTTSLTTNPNPAFLGATVTLTATVSPSFAPGQVTFYNGSTLLGIMPLVANGTATLQVPFSAGGTYSLQAVYSGGQTVSPNQTITYSSSTSPVVTQTVLIFLSAPTYATDSAPVSVAVADFNGDGKPDLAVANSIGADVSVLLNNGGGTFLAAVNYSVGNNPTSVVVGDVNGDGKLDLICTATGPQGAGVWVLLGKDDGTFQLAVSSQPAGASPSWVAVGDFNGDGKLDLAVTSGTSSGGVNILIGKGDGTFNPPVYYATDTVSTSVAVADFNRDGKPDLVVVNAGSDNVSVLLGNGDGTFQVLMHFGSGFGESSVVAGDFNADGKPDFAVSIEAGVTVFLGKGDGTFQTQANYSAPLAGGPVVVGDFNGDGKPDFAQVGPSNTVSVLLGNGNGTFQPATAYSVGIGPSSAAVGDFNGDGKADLAVTDAGPFTTGAAGFVSILLGNGNGTFQAAPDYGVAGPSSVAVGDFNGDGKADLALADGGVSVLLGNGDGTFQPAVNYPAGAIGVSVAVGDFNGDGKMDLVVADSGGGVSVLLGNGDGTFQAAVSYATAAGSSSVAIGDFNLDGKPDLAVANSTGNYVSVLLGNGNGTFRAAVNYPVGMAPRSVAIGDLNGDGKADLAVANFGVNQLNNFVQGNISVLLGNGDGTFKPAVNYIAGGNPASVAIGDFNGDGKPDLAVAAFGGAVSNDGAWVLMGNGNGTFQTAMFNLADVLPQAIAVGDFNGDGRADLAVANSFSGDVSMLLGYGNGTFQPAVNYTVGVDPIGLAAGDFNGDARADLGVANNMGSGLTVLLSYEPRLTITKTHAGSFFPGEQNATYTMIVSNRTNASMTSGPVTVSDTLPSGLTLVSMAGSGWSCSSSTCSRSDSLAGSASYPSITVTVNVAVNASSPQVNQASVSGGGSATASASDSTIVNQGAMSVSPSTLMFGYSGQQITGTQTVALNFNPSAGLAWTASSNQSNITVRPASGTGSAVLQITATPGASGIITVTAPGASNSPQQIHVNLTSVASSMPFGSFDTPLNNTTGIAGAIPVTGWALDNIGVANVAIWREPVPNEPTAANGLVFIGDAVFVEGARPDVQAAFPNTPFNYRAGWGYQMLTNFLANSNGSGPLGNGTYKLHALVTNQMGQTMDLGTRTITVDNAHATKPFGTIDTPAQGGTVSGNAYLNFGWALTQNPYSIPVDGSTLTVFVDGVAMGHPAYNQFRKDIATLFPGLANSNGAVGFFYIDTTKLANGLHTISWSVTDNAGRVDGIGSRYFTVANTGGVTAPATDQPIEGAQVASGVYSVSMQELGRIELQVGATDGYLLVNGEREPLPVGSTLQRGRFYWQAGPGFLGEYELLFERADSLPVRVHVKVQPRFSDVVR